MLGISYISFLCLIIAVGSQPFLNDINSLKSNPYNSQFSYPYIKQNVDILIKSLSSLYFGLEFFYSVKNDLDIDGLLGVRIVSDQLNVTLGVLYDHNDAPKPWTRILATTLIDLQQQAEDLFEKALPQVISNDPIYFKGIGKILKKGMWSYLPNNQLAVDKFKEYNEILALDQIPMNESISDLCVSELFRKCDISWNCWKVMSGFGFQDYQLSHQVFYLEIGKMEKCERKMENLIRRSDQISIIELLTIFCTNMYREAEEIADNFYPTEYKDLFMENIAFCGIIGFNEFTANKEWIKRIMKWQNSIGCYLKSSDINRKKRREKVLDNGCGTHTTSMALASSVYFIWSRVYRNNMDRTFCDMIFSTSVPFSSDDTKHNNNESLFPDWNCNEAEVDFCLNMYDQLLIDNNDIENDYSSEWESCVSDDLEDQTQEGSTLQTIPSLTPSLIQIAKKDETIELINFCQVLTNKLPKFCDFDQIDAGVREEMNATENDTVNMDLLTCSAATANCYRESSQKPIIRSKYGKWSCGGKFNPAIGLGPLSQLFMDNYVSNKIINQQNRLEFNQNQSLQNSMNFIPTVNSVNNQIRTEFEYRDYERDMTNEMPDCYPHQIYYNRDYNNLLNDSQNNYCTKNAICNDKCCKTETQSHRESPHYQQMSSSNSCANSWHYNFNSYNNYNCEPNLMQSTFF